MLGAAGGYLDAHPGANDVLTAAASQPALASAQPASAPAPAAASEPAPAAAASSPAPNPAADDELGDGFFANARRDGIEPEHVRSSYGDDDSLHDDFSEADVLKRRRPLTPE